MPTMTDQFNHAKNVVQWKIDQQSRISKLNTQINELESTVIRYKSDLADQTLILHSQKKIKSPELSKICITIDEISLELNKCREAIELVRNEKPPVIAEISPLNPKTLSGLICPTCGEALVGQFCPKDGVKGVPPEPLSGLVCPKCGNVVPVKFCPIDGTEGVPYKKDIEGSVEPKKEKELIPKSKPSEPICPKCGTPVPVKFCPNCGTEVVVPNKK